MSVSLIIGADGVLGQAIVARERELGHSVIETRRRGNAGPACLDIASMSETWPIPPQVTVAYVCAAITSQRECAINTPRAYATNVTGTYTIARRLVEAGVFVVFPSTNMVFDGSRPFVSPLAATCPRTTYGRMKAEAERSLLAIGGRVGVVRLSKVVYGNLPVFAQWQVAFESGCDVLPFEDLLFSPLPIVDAANVLIAVARSRAEGIVQASAAEDISYADACRIVAERLGVAPSRVRPISWREKGGFLEHAPAHTTLDSTRASEISGFTPPKARAAIESAMNSPVTSL